MSVFSPVRGSESTTGTAKICAACALARPDVAPPHSCRTSYACQHRHQAGRAGGRNCASQVAFSTKSPYVWAGSLSFNGVVQRRETTPLDDCAHGARFALIHAQQVMHGMAG
jgi:hypothetical protein